MSGNQVIASSFAVLRTMRFAGATLLFAAVLASQVPAHAMSYPPYGGVINERSGEYAIGIKCDGRWVALPVNHYANEYCNGRATAYNVPRGSVVYTGHPIAAHTVSWNKRLKPGIHKVSPDQLVWLKRVK